MFNLMRAETADLPSVIEVLREVRGDTFYHEKIYSVAYLSDSHEIAVFAAKTHGGEIAGLIAATKSLFCHECDLLCLLAVRKRFLGLGIASALYSEGVRHLHEMGAQSIKAHMVTDSEAPLRIAEKHGLIPTGLLFNVRDNAKGLREYALRTEKRTTAVYVKEGTKKDAGTLYLPERLHTIANHVYDKLGVIFELSEEEKPAKRFEVLNHNYDDFHSVTYIQIIEYGSDTGQTVSRLIENDEPLHTALLLLNINSPTAICAFEILTDMGFKFSGFYPLCSDYEYVILYYGRYVKACTDEIKKTEKLNWLLSEVLDIE